MMELLAPAGSWESMVAAVQNGADAIYLGGSMFNARRFADNFTTNEQLQKALDYCHIRDVKVYVACNTLLLDKEIPAALEYAGFLYEAGADALIVQDLGFVDLLRANFPQLPLHASTQMAVHSLCGVQRCEEMGLERVVLARELSLEDIRYIHSKSSMPLECFGHGALCTAVSGNCLFSSLAGGRSGNRGACAQPCRKPYCVQTEGHISPECYPLSLSDLCMLPHVEKLAQAGVSSLKIEGRMQRPEYVAAVIHAYRAAIDGASQAELFAALKNIQAIFLRGENGTGYYFKNSAVRPNARARLSTKDSPIEYWKASYQAENKKREVTGTLSLQVGKPPILCLHCGEHTIEISGEQPLEQAQKPVDIQRYRQQIAKLNDTPFVLGECTVEMTSPAHVPASVLNGLRRNAVEALTGAFCIRRKPVTLKVDAAILPQRAEPLGILGIVPDAESAAAALRAGADAVALAPYEYSEHLFCMLKPLQCYRDQGKKLLLMLPAFSLSPQEEQQWGTLLNSSLLDGAIAQNMGQVRLMRQCAVKIAGPLCNAANRFAVGALVDAGFDQVVLSLELTKAQLRDIIKQCPGRTCVYAYGRVQVMQLCHCPVKSVQGCILCDGRPGALVDEANRRFPLDRIRQEGGCLVRVRNSQVLDILDRVHELPQPGGLMLEFFDETPAVVEERVKAAKLALEGGTPPCLGTTRGHWSRGWEI